MKISNYLAGTALIILMGFSLPGCTREDRGPNTNNWATQNLYWQDNFSTRPYYQAGITYDAYEPAYQYGFNAYKKYGRKPFNQIEPQLQGNWYYVRGNSTLTWDQAEPAVQDSYNRMYDNQGAPPIDTEDSTAGAGSHGRNPFNSGAATGTTLGR
jgi:hypothetical protein